MAVGNSLPQAYGGNGDGFVAAFDLTGRRLFAFYWGGSGIDQGNGIAVGPTGSVYALGWTTSTNLQVVNALQPMNAGGVDFMVGKLSSAAGWSYLTYFGGSGHEHPTGGFIQNSSRPSGGIDVDNDDNAYIIGTTFSATLPKVNAYSTTATGPFLSKLNATGSALLYSSTFGLGRGCAIDADDNGHVIFSGLTTADSFPVRNAFQPTHGGSVDAFITQVDTTKSGDASLLFSSYLGGAGYDAGYGVRSVSITGVKHAVVAGKTNSTTFPGATQPSGGSVFRSIGASATWRGQTRGSPALRSSLTGLGR